MNKETKGGRDGWTDKLTDRLMKTEEEEDEEGGEREGEDRPLGDTCVGKANR